MMKKAFILMCASAALMLTACGNSKPQATETSDEPQETVEAVVEQPSASYDIEGIKALTKKKQLTEAEQDFVLDQYEIFCRETKGLDNKAKKNYLKDKGAEGKVIMLVVMGAENSKSMTDAQRARLSEIQEKYQ